MATEWHAEAHCVNQCDWRTDQRGEAKAVGQPVDLAARKHMESNKGHGTSNSMHRALYCKQLGCPDEGA